jgi:hypothetical protein
VSGGFSGYTEDKRLREEQERLARAEARQQELDARAAERQTMADLVTLQDKGYMPEAEQATMRQQAGTAASRAASTAMAALRGGASATPFRADDALALRGGVGAMAPQQRVTMGGQTLTRESPLSSAMRAAQEKVQAEERAAREEERRTKQAFDTEVKDAKDAFGMTDAQARDYVRQKKSPFLPMSAKERADLANEARRLSISEAAVGRADRDYDLRLREQDRRESDSVRRREAFPVSVQGKLAGIESGVLMAGDVREAIASNPEAIGPVKGRVFRSVLDAMDKEGVGVRASIESLSGEIRNQRFGGALTANEAKFAEGMLPSEKDDAEVAISKLTQLENYLERKREGFFRVYRQPYSPLAASQPQGGDSASSASRPPLSSFRR